MENNTENQSSSNHPSAKLKRIRKLFDRDSMRAKLSCLSELSNVSLKHLDSCSYDTNHFKGNIENPIGVCQVPVGIIGPVPVAGGHANGEFYVPMATTEGALLLTYDIGAHLLGMSEPVKVEILSKVIHITPMFVATVEQRDKLRAFVSENYATIKSIAEKDSSHTALLGIEHFDVDDVHLLQFRFDTGDAHGLNMINHATFQACQFIASTLSLEFYHRSHFSGVKHHCPRNESYGYGRKVKASAVISGRVLKLLRVTAQQLKSFNDRCIKCARAAGVQNVNVHASNALAAIFLACGQDVADLSSCHVCNSNSEVVNGGKDLYWEITLPNLLVGTVGGGTVLATQSECLSIMGCLGSGKSDKFAEIIAATVLTGEFPTAAAVVNKSYVEVHNTYGRNKTPKLF